MHRPCPQTAYTQDMSVRLVWRAHICVYNLIASPYVIWIKRHSLRFCSNDVTAELNAHVNMSAYLLLLHLFFVVWKLTSARLIPWILIWCVYSLDAYHELLKSFASEYSLCSELQEFTVEVFANILVRRRCVKLLIIITLLHLDLDSPSNQYSL